MKLSEKQLLVLETIGYLQLFTQSFCTEKLEDEIYFVSNGSHIVHPLLDETGREEVDPVSYYGEKFLNSRFMDFI